MGVTDSNVVVYRAPSFRPEHNFFNPLAKSPPGEGSTLSQLKLLAEQCASHSLVVSDKTPHAMNESRSDTIHGLKSSTSTANCDAIVDQKSKSDFGRQVTRFAYRYREKGTSLLKKLAGFLFVQGNLYQSVSNLSSDVKLIGGFEHLAHGESFVSGGSTPIAVSVGGALSAVGVMCVTTQLASDAAQIYQGRQRVKAHDAAVVAHQEALHAGNSAEINAAIAEINALQAGKVLGEEMKASGKESLAITSGWAATYAIDAATSSISIASLASTTVANMKFLSSLSSGLSVFNTALCTPLFAYGLYSNLCAGDNHARTAEIAESLVEKYGIGASQADQELSTIANLVKERQAYKGKRFLAGTTVAKMVGGIIGATSTLMTPFVVGGTSAAMIVNMLSPIGWTIGGVATAGLVGYGIYKVGRYLQRRSQINELHALAAHTMPDKGDVKLPELSSKQSAWLQSERARIRTEFREKTGQEPLWQEVDAAIHMEVLQKLLKVDPVYASRVLLYRFKEEVDNYLEEHPGIGVKDLARKDFASIGPTAAFLCEFGAFDEMTLKSIYQADPERDKDAVKLIRNRLNL
ncbi:MAG TPA: hypothetical protein DIU37_02635 [Opitutae bacterium]|nr:hypothetical protein [Opitutae bacterium]